MEDELPSYLRPVPDIPPFYFPLNDELQNAIEMNYGASTCPNIETSAKPPDSPTTALSNAAEYLVKMNKKGYHVMQGVPPEQIRRTFTRSLKPVIFSQKSSRPKTSLKTSGRIVTISSNPTIEKKNTSPKESKSTDKQTTPKLNQLKVEVKTSTNTSDIKSTPSLLQTQPNLQQANKQAPEIALSKLKVNSNSIDIINISKPKKKSEKKTSLQDSRFNDPELRFFIQSNVLKKMKNKILSLPFTIKEDGPVLVSKLQERIIEIGHRMQHLHMFDSKKLSRSQLQENTAKFVSEAKDAGNDLIRMAFKDKLIDFDAARKNKELYEEFKDQFPEQNSRPEIKTTPSLSKRDEINLKNDEILFKIIDQSTANGDLPRGYTPNIERIKMPGFTISSQANTNQLRKKLTAAANMYKQALSRPATAPLHKQINNEECLEIEDKENDDNKIFQPRKTTEIITCEFTRKPKTHQVNRSPDRHRRKTHLATLNLNEPENYFFSGLTSVRSTYRDSPPLSAFAQKERDKKIFWESADPLGSQRSGNYVDQLETISQLSNEINLDNLLPTVDDMIYEPFKLTENKPTPIVSSHQNSPIISKENSVVELKQEKIEKQESKPVVRQNDLFGGNYAVSSSKSEIIHYLNEHENDFDGDINQSPIYARLGKIWEELGFSINQKLEMVLKYSSGIELSTAFGDAIQSWENAYTNINNYQESYTNMKVFLNNEVHTIQPDKRGIIYQELLDEMEIAIANVQQSASYLKATYGDDLLMRRRKVSEVISSRNLKLQILANQAGILETSKH